MVRPRGGAHERQHLVVDDEPDVADLFRQCFCRGARRGTYVLHFAYSGRDQDAAAQSAGDDRDRLWRR